MHVKGQPYAFCFSIILTSDLLTDLRLYVNLQKSKAITLVKCYIYTMVEHSTINTENVT